MEVGEVEVVGEVGEVEAWECRVFQSRLMLEMHRNEEYVLELLVNALSR